MGVGLLRQPLVLRFESVTVRYIKTKINVSVFKSQYLLKVSKKWEWIQISCSNAEPQQTESSVKPVGASTKAYQALGALSLCRWFHFPLHYHMGLTQTQFKHPEIVSFYNVYKGDSKIYLVHNWGLINMWHPLRLKTPLRFCSPFQNPSSRFSNSVQWNPAPLTLAYELYIASNYNSCVIPTKLRIMSRQFTTLKVESTKWKERVILWVIFPDSEVTKPQY